MYSIINRPWPVPHVHLLDFPNIMIKGSELCIKHIYVYICML